MRVVVTGGAGFIGSHVAEILIAAGHEVLVIDNLSGGCVENVPAAARFENRNVQDPLEDLFRDFSPEAVYHLAAYAAEGLSHHIPLFNYANNVLGTVNVLNAAFRASVRHFVFTSSIAAYGHPGTDGPFDELTPCLPCDPYGAAKLACEHHIAAFHKYYGRPGYTIVRPHNVFGPRQNISDPYRNVVGIFMRCVMEGAPMPVFGDGTQTRSFSYITSVARCIAEAPFTKGAEQATFNVGGDEPMTVRDLAQQVANLFGTALNLEWLPARREVTHAHCRHERVARIFPHLMETQISIADGLKRMAEFVRVRPVPRPTECPASIEIADHLPASWANRLCDLP